MIDQLSTQRLLGEFRGERAVDRDALAATLVALGKVATERDDIVSVDVNPLIVTPDGAAVAVDALVEVGDGDPARIPTGAPARHRPPSSSDALFEPRGVLVTGASTHPGKFGFVSLHNLLAAGYAGPRVRHQPAGRGGARHPDRGRRRRPARRRDRPRLRVHPGVGERRTAAGVRGEGRQGGVPHVGRLRRGRRRGQAGGGRAGRPRRRARDPARRPERPGGRQHAGRAVRPDRRAVPAGRTHRRRQPERQLRLQLPQLRPGHGRRHQPGRVGGQRRRRLRRRLPRPLRRRPGDLRRPRLRRGHHRRPGAARPPRRRRRAQAAGAREGRARPRAGRGPRRATPARSPPTTRSSTASAAPPGSPGRPRSRRRSRRRRRSPRSPRRPGPTWSC